MGEKSLQAFIYKAFLRVATGSNPPLSTKKNLKRTTEM